MKSEHIGQISCTQSARAVAPDRAAVDGTRGPYAKIAVVQLVAEWYDQSCHEGLNKKRKKK